jgi:hypothetical protein
MALHENGFAGEPGETVWLGNWMQFNEPTDGYKFRPLLGEVRREPAKRLYTGFLSLM